MLPGGQVCVRIFNTSQKNSDAEEEFKKPANNIVESFAVLTMCLGNEDRKYDGQDNTSFVSTSTPIKPNAVYASLYSAVHQFF
jgi:hypothetical protein